MFLLECSGSMQGKKRKSPNLSIVAQTEAERGREEGRGWVEEKEQRKR